MDRVSLREWRVSHLYTAEELGVILDVSPITIHRWERGEREPASWRMIDLALKGLLFTHSNAGNTTCRCGHTKCSHRPDRYASNGRAYEPH